jgi:alpha-galactosidase
MLLLALFSGLALASVPVQDPNDVTLSGCFPNASTEGGGELHTLRSMTTPNGFTAAARGWNSWAVQAVPKAVPEFIQLDQGFVISQCDVLADDTFRGAGYTLCSIDAGWSTNDPDEFGRILYNTTLFDMPALGDHLHSKGLQLGVYIIPGFPCNGLNRTIKGTDIQLSRVWNGNNDGLQFCDFDFTKDGVQQWHDSLIELWTGWGVDMIKLDFITPGSPQNGANLTVDNSGAVIAYHKAIQNSGKQVRLDISWKLCRNDTFYDIWRANADSMRTDQDINNYGGNTLIAIQQAQRAIENYRQYISLQTEKGQPLSIFPDMDSLIVGNPEAITGITDSQRQTLASHFIGAGANLILGADMTQLDDFGRNLLVSQASIDATAFCSAYPMQPRNPGTGKNTAQQLQAWISGPDPAGNAIVLLANLGYTRGEAGYSTQSNGTQTVAASFADLGINQNCYNVTDIWAGGTTTVMSGGTISGELGDFESKMLKLTLC